MSDPQARPIQKPFDAREKARIARFEPRAGLFFFCIAMEIKSSSAASQQSPLPQQGSH